MLKRNLFAAALLIICVVSANDAFGQRNRRQAKTRQSAASTTAPNAKIRKPATILTETTIPAVNQTPNAPQQQQSRSRRKPRWETPELDADSNVVQTNPPQTAKVKNPQNTASEKNKPPRASGYIGETEKNVTNPRAARSNRNNQPKAATATTKPTAKKKVKPFIGSSEDGQSIKQKQPARKPRRPHKP